jgi:hypothetical protein
MLALPQARVPEMGPARDTAARSNDVSPTSMCEINRPLTLYAILDTKQRTLTVVPKRFIFWTRICSSGIPADPGGAYVHGQAGKTALNFTKSIARCHSLVNRHNYSYKVAGYRYPSLRNTNLIVEPVLLWSIIYLE